jgi:solute carrier family 25 phosphate transporter 3
MTTHKVKEPTKDTMGQPLTPNFSAKDYSIFFSTGALCTSLIEPILLHPRVIG